MQINEKLLQDIKEAWEIEGKCPEWHKHQQELLRKNFPTLWRAVQNVSDFYK